MPPPKPASILHLSNWCVCEHVLKTTHLTRTHNPNHTRTHKTAHLQLLAVGRRRGQHYRVLHEADAHHARRPQLLRRCAQAEAPHLKASLRALRAWRVGLVGGRAWVGGRGAGEGGGREAECVQGVQLTGLAQCGR